MPEYGERKLILSVDLGGTKIATALATTHEKLLLENIALLWLKLGLIL